MRVLDINKYKSSVFLQNIFYLKDIFYDLMNLKGLNNNNEFENKSDFPKELVDSLRSSMQVRSRNEKSLYNSVITKDKINTFSKENNHNFNNTLRILSPRNKLFISNSDSITSRRVRTTEKDPSIVKNLFIPKSLKLKKNINNDIEYVVEKLKQLFDQNTFTDSLSLKENNNAINNSDFNSPLNMSLSKKFKKLNLSANKIISKSAIKLSPKSNFYISF